MFSQGNVLKIAHKELFNWPLPITINKKGSQKAPFARRLSMDGLSHASLQCILSRFLPNLHLDDLVTCAL
jgi:hypothetical protein